LVTELCRTRLGRKAIGWNQFRGSQRRPGYERECEIYEEITSLNRHHKTIGRGVVG
jgi:hypothetical protein